MTVTGNECGILCFVPVAVNQFSFGGGSAARKWRAHRARDSRDAAPGPQPANAQRINDLS